MSFPDIHTCIKLSAENNDLRKKYLKIKEQRDTYYKELSEIKQKQQTENLLRNYVTTRDSSCQTEASRSWQPVCIKSKTQQQSKETDADKTNKLLSMHSQVMRRYEKEVKLNMSHMETITELNIQISELERKLNEEKDKSKQRDLQSVHGDKSRTVKRKTEDNDEKSSQTKKECIKLKKENDKLKKELKGLDLGFFEEIEDIKFALQQSAKLNKEYEQTLRRMCTKFGIPYPHPEKKILNDRTKWK